MKRRCELLQSFQFLFTFCWGSFFFRKESIFKITFGLCTHNKLWSNDDYNYFYPSVIFLSFHSMLLSQTHTHTFQTRVSIYVIGRVRKRGFVFHSSVEIFLYKKDLHFSPTRGWKKDVRFTPVYAILIFS